MQQKFNFFYTQANSFGLPQKFIQACKKIEQDPNYQPNVSNEQLMSLVMDERGNARHSPRKNALAIQRSPIDTDLGMLYQIKIAQKSPLDDQDYIPVWHIDNNIVILVKTFRRYFFS